MHSVKTASLDVYKNMDQSLVSNYVLNIKDFLYPFFEDRKVTSTTFRSKYQTSTDQLLKTAFQCFQETPTVPKYTAAAYAR